MPDESLNTNEPVELDETQKNTLDIATKTGLEDLITDISIEFNLATFDEKSDIPVPVKMVPLSEHEITTTDSVNDTLKNLLEMANNSEHSLEVPFAIIGKSGELNSVEMLFDDDALLENTIAFTNPDKLGDVYNKILKSEDLDTLVVSHTHPKVPEQIKEKTLTHKMPQKLKAKYGIKDAGLNLSLQDLYQLESLHEQIGDKVNVLLGVLMYNGDLILVERTKEGFRGLVHKTKHD